MKNTNETLQLCLLGQFELSINDVVISESERHSSLLWNLLAYLITNRNRQISHSELIENLWNNDTSSNPLSSLKTALNRLRKQLAPIGEIAGELILSSRGAYQFNPSIPVIADVDIFKEEFLLGMDTQQSIEDRIFHLQKACTVYKGDYLPLHKDELWLSPMVTNLHLTFREATLTLFSLLDEKKDYASLLPVISRALMIDPLEEVFHCELIEVLMKQGNTMDAIEHCRFTQDLLYQNLRVQASPRLSALFNQLLKDKHALGMSEEGIIETLNTSTRNDGAFYCDYAIFEEIYRLESRRNRRSSKTSQICILTLKQSNEIPSLEILNMAMPWLLQSISQCLRGGDVVTKVSGAQYLLLLPMADRENAERVVERIRENYYKHHRKSLLQIASYLHDVDSVSS
ncbi:DNA-binding transcriptional activator of the SARP family [Lachnospiraceae bacterium XBB1006]|nr:DNA-binding transcriptional activator of the SARP family [Lachnospiraceae bacterium XBB1006]